MSRYRDQQPIIDGLFRQRGEEVVAGETISEIGSKKKASKPRLLILTRPLGSTGPGGATFTIISVEGDSQRVKLKSAFAVDRLTDVSREGNYDATFNFGASGLLSVSFESHIQREMFVAAARRLQSTAGAGGPRGGYADARMGVIRGVLTEAVGAAVEADAAARVRKLRQDKRRVFTTEEEQHLLRHMGGDGAGFDDIRQFQDALLRQQKSAELKSLDLLTTSDQAWQAAQQQVQNLVQDVEEVERRIEEYSTHLISKKSVIQQVEHDNNTLQRKQQNLESLYIMMSDLREQLRLAPATLSLLARLRTVSENDLVAFFSEGSNAVTLSVAMKQMQSVLHNPKLDSDFPITAVAERKSYFLDQRKMITQRSKAYILATIDSFEAQYLADKTRYSRESMLVWRLHVELSAKLMNISDIILALGRLDVEGFGAALRKYRTSMQKIYSIEVTRFFRCLRKQVKKVNTWRGPFLLGTSESRKEAIAMQMETAQAGETPRAYGRSYAATPALTPRLMHFDDDEVNSLAARSDADHTHLSVEFPSVADLRMSGNVPSSAIELFESANTLRRLDARAVTSSVASGIKSLTSTSSGGGYVRPDLAFAIALESVVLALLHEETILHNCFGLSDILMSSTEFGVQIGGAAAAAAGGRDGWSSPLDDGHPPTPPSSPPPPGVVADPQTETERRQMMQDSLLELFGGADARALVRELQGTSRSTSARQSRSSSQSRDIGLPPRPPPASGGFGRSSVSSTGRDGFFPHRRTFSGASASSAGTGEGEDEAESVDDGTARSAMHRCFLLRTMRDLANYFVEKCDRVYCIPVLCMIRAYRRQTENAMLPAKSAFCQVMLSELEALVRGGLVRFVAEQTESVTRCRKRYMVKPTALLHCFAKLPAFFLRLEAVHNALAANVCDRTEYASIAMSLVDQAFDALDLVTNVKATGDEMSEEQMKLSKVIAQKLHSVIDGVEADINSLKWVFIQQYRHQSFFCAFYSTMPSDSFAIELLLDHHTAAKVKRDRYEELYLTRVILVQSFPVFGVFAISAEDLSRIYAAEELRHHKALAVDAVGKVVNGLERELRSGVRASAIRMKKHFLRDVDLNGNAASFHQTLLQRTWQHFSALLLQKFDFVVSLLAWAVYKDLSMPLRRADVVQMLSEY